MNILILTNTFTPHVGGVARSVEAFVAEYRRRGHRVLVVAPEFPDMPQDETDVVRIHAIQHFNASDFSVALPIHPHLTRAIDAFNPDISMDMKESELLDLVSARVKEAIVNTQETRSRLKATLEMLDARGD